SMRLIDKLQSLFILAAIAIGLALGQVNGVAARADSMIMPFLMIMLTVVFLHITLRGFGDAFRHMRFTRLSLGINFLWTPVFAWLLGLLFLRNTPDIWVGFLMLLVTPCTDWYLVFTQMARGNVHLGATLLPWHILLQLLLLPIYLFIFAGAVVPLSPQILLQSVGLVLLIPLLTASALRMALTARFGKLWLETAFLPKVAPLQIIFLCMAIGAMFASQGSAIQERPELIGVLLLPLGIFYMSNLALGLLAGRAAGLDYAACTSLCFATIARNSPVALAVAVAAFPQRPLIALALAIGPLLELPVLAAISQLLQHLPKWIPSLTIPRPTSQSR
ncbi:MAG: arsenic resistance protein, partial [Litorilinea sp.]